MRRHAWLVLAGLLAGGCAGLPRESVTVSTVGLAALTSWVATGRLAVAADSGGGSGNFVWRQDGADTRLTIRGPLGAGALEIVSDGTGLTVTDASGRTLGDEAHAVLATRLGADLPLPSFRYWMIGLPWPDATARVDEPDAGPGRVIDQQGWTIRYDAFRSEQGFALPARLTATTGAVRLKLVVDGWDLAPEPPDAMP